MMMTNQRKMMRMRKNSQSKHQQKTLEDKRAFFKRTWTCKPQLREIETQPEPEEMESQENLLVSHQDYQEFAYYYGRGQVNLSTFVQEQFKFKMDDEGCENSAGWRKKVGSNSLIVKEILGYMNFSTLKIARLVCKEWNSLANFELGRRNCCRMRFQRDFLLQKDLDLEFLRNSVDLSWIEFDFENLDDTELECIATFCGSQIKMLKIYPENFSLVRSFFNAGEFPNVKSLSFHDHFYAKNSKTRTENPLATEFRNLLKLLRKEANSNSNFSKFQAQNQPKPQLKLEELLIGNRNCEDHPEFVDQINQILESNQKSLKFLELPLPLCSNSRFQRWIQIPGILNQISTIHFHINCDQSDKIESKQFQLPQGFEQKNLPNLKTVRFEFKPVNSWSLLAFLWTRLRFLPLEKTKPGTEICLSSVINFEVGYKCNYPILNSLRNSIPLKWFLWISAWFPNIQNVVVDNWQNEDVVLGHVFAVWPNLTTLKIQRHFSSKIASKVMDSVFTGLSEEKCDELRNNFRAASVRMSMKILEMKTEPNLNSLKELKRLDIHVMGPSFCSPVSKISWVYAFHLNPELKVGIHRFPETAKKCTCSCICFIPVLGTMI